MARGVEAASTPLGFKFSTRIRVRFAETDAQGVVYHANFLVYCEVGRVEYSRAVLGAPGIMVSRDWEPTVVRAELDFKQPARFDDEVDVLVRVSRLGTTSYTFAYEMRRASDGELLVRASTVQVTVDRATHRPRPLPDELVAAVLAFEPVAPERG